MDNKKIRIFLIAFILSETLAPKDLAAKAPDACTRKLADSFHDLSVWAHFNIVRRVIDHPLTQDLSALSKAAAKEKGGSGALVHRSLMGVEYEPGSGALTDLIPPLQRWLVRNNGKWTPFTWQGKDGHRYQLDPIQGIYMWWSSRYMSEAQQLTMLSSFLNVLDASHLRFILGSALVLGGAYGYRNYEDKKDLNLAREEYAFLEDFSEKEMSLGHSSSKDPNAVANTIIQDIAASPDQYKKILDTYRNSSEDSNNLALLLQHEVTLLTKALIKESANLSNPSSMQLLELAALKNLYQKRASLPASTQKNLEIIWMAFNNPSFWKLREAYLSDLSVYKKHGFGLYKKGPLGSQIDDWDNNKAVVLSLQNPQHLKVFSEILRDQVERNLELQDARRRADGANDVELLNPTVANVAKTLGRARDKKFTLKLEMAYVYYKTNTKMMRAVGVFPVKNETGSWRPLNDAEVEAQIKDSLLKLK